MNQPVVQANGCTVSEKSVYASSWVVAPVEMLTRVAIYLITFTTQETLNKEIEFLKYIFALVHDGW